MGSRLDSLVPALGWLAVLIILLGVLWLVWFMLRKWYRGGMSDEPGSAPWTLEDLRRLRSRGEITPEEYDSLRQQMIGGFKDTK